MDMSWLHTFFEWISSIIIQIPDYYKHAIDVLGYGYSDKIGYPGEGLFVVIFLGLDQHLWEKLENKF